MNCSCPHYLRCCRYSQWISKAKSREGSNHCRLGRPKMLPNLRLMPINCSFFIFLFLCYTSCYITAFHLELLSMSSSAPRVKKREDRARSNGTLRESRERAVFALLGASQGCKAREWQSIQPIFLSGVFQTYQFSCCFLNMCW